MDFDFNFLCFSNMRCNRHHLFTDRIILNILFKIVQAWYLVTNFMDSKNAYSLFTENWLGVYTVRIVCFSLCRWVIEVTRKSACTVYGATWGRQKIAVLFGRKVRKTGQQWHWKATRPEATAVDESVVASSRACVEPVRQKRRMVLTMVSCDLQQAAVVSNYI